MCLETLLHISDVTFIKILPYEYKRNRSVNIVTLLFIFVIILNQ